MTTPAAAQEKGDIGLTISAPSALGVIWHVSERLAIRPEMSFSFSETDAESSTLTDVSSHSSLAVFAEAGLMYSSSESKITTILPTDRTSWAFGSRTAIGGTLYF